MLTALASPWLVLAAATVTYDGAVRAEARARTPLPEEAGPVGGDAELTPSLGLTVRGDGGWSAQLTYAPRLAAYPRGGVETLHAGRAQAGWGPGPGVELFAREQATYGQLDPLTLAQASSAASGSLTPLPSAGTIFYLSSQTDLGLETTALAPRLRLSALVGLGVSGGADEAAQRALPRQAGPRLSAAADYALTPLDALGAVLSGSHTLFSNGQRDSVLVLTGLWRRRIDPQTSGELGAGLSLARSLGPVQQGPGQAGPTASAAIAHRLPGRDFNLEGRLAGRLEPFVDPLTGLVYQRAEADLGLTWTLGERLLAFARAGGALPLARGALGTLARGEAGGRWSLSRELHLEAAVLAQGGPGAAPPPAPPVQWMASISLVVSRSGAL